MVAYKYLHTTVDSAVKAAYDMEASVAEDLGVEVDSLEAGVFYDCCRSVEFDVDPAVRPEFLRRVGLSWEE